MNVTTPRLVTLPDGRFVTKWGGKRHYFGRDPDEAVSRYAESIKVWRRWRTDRAKAMAVLPTERISVIRLAEKFIDSKEAGGDRQALDVGSYYRKHLKRFLHFYGDSYADEIRVRHLQSLKQDMQASGYANKTFNHDLTAVKGVLQFGMDLEFIPPFNLRGCKSLPTGPVQHKALPVAEVRKLIRQAPAKIAAWLAVNYLTVARPSEVVRVVHGQGQWAEKGIFQLDRGKTDLRARLKRHLVFSPEALGWIAKCRPVWSRLDTYSAAVRGACGVGPGIMRHSAATHLLRLGVARDDVDCIRGHYPSRVSLIYAQIPWQPLRRKAARLKL